jgi:adenylate kinase
MNNDLVQPQLIILYGPPGSGKGTQAKMLQEEYGYEFLDFGQSFRNFVKISNQLTPQDQVRANRVNIALSTGKAILTEDFFYILLDKIEYFIKNKINFVIDKPGSLIEEAKWFNNIIVKNKITTIFIHLVLVESKALDRITHRWYINSSQTPFKSYNEALKSAVAGELPYQRQDDQSVDVSSQRIRNLYGQHNEIINEYIRHGIKIHNIDADATMTVVSNRIKKLLEHY